MDAIDSIERGVPTHILLHIKEASDNRVEEDFNHRIVQYGAKHLFYTHEDKESKLAIYSNVNFVALQRMNIYFLQRRLANKTAGILAQGTMRDEDAECARKLLHQLCKSVLCQLLFLLRKTPRLLLNFSRVK